MGGFVARYAPNPKAVKARRPSRGGGETLPGTCEGWQADMAFNPGKFLREVRTESAKIVWPTRRETLMTGLMVVIMTSLLALFFFGIDALFSAVVKFLLGLIG